MKKKKFKTPKIIIIVIIIISLVCLFPYKIAAMNDGGTMFFKSLVYEIKKIHRQSGYDGSYAKGIVVKIFGKTVYKHFNPELIIHNEQKKLTEIYAIDEKIKVKVFTEIEVEYRFKKEIMSLKEALEKKRILMEDITFSMDLTSSLNEGRINLYKSDDFLTKKIFYIAECQGLNQDGKRSFNYFIGLSENVSKYCESNFNQ